VLRIILQNEQPKKKVMNKTNKEGYPFLLLAFKRITRLDAESTPNLIDFVQLLVENGSDPHAQIEEIFSEEKSGASDTTGKENVYSWDFDVES